MDKNTSLKNKIVPIAAVAVLALVAWWAWKTFTPKGPGEGFVGSNGRVEATEIDISTKLPGRVEEILVREGDFVQAGQPVARMQIDTLRAQRQEADAMRQQAEHSVAAAEAQVVGVRSQVQAATATVARVQADIDDGVLKAPRDGRVQLRVAQPGEVLGAGGRVLNLLDLSDVYMTFFVPETAAGRIALGSEVRLVLDAAPEYVIPARVSFVASQAQFTPKTVETASERQKLMFRVRAQIPPELLRRHLEQVKTGVPGMAWLRTDASHEWPANLAIKLPAQPAQ